MQTSSVENPPSSWDLSETKHPSISMLTTMSRNLRQQQDFADPATAKQFGKELGADVMLFGEMTSEEDIYNNKRVVNYITTLFLTDVETSKRIWYGQQEIKKFVKN
jgi:PBP1b-binding outer membrane lipoprotein LpoB